MIYDYGYYNDSYHIDYADCYDYDDYEDGNDYDSTPDDYGDCR